MPSFAVEILYFMAFGLFLLGAALSFRENGSPRAVAIMSCGVLADSIARMLPLSGLAHSPLFMGFTGSCTSFAIAFGMITTCPAFLLALLFRKRGLKNVFHWMIAALEMVWFLDIILLLYGLYGVALAR
jgi:hypothetical protein